MAKSHSVRWRAAGVLPAVSLGEKILELVSAAYSPHGVSAGVKGVYFPPSASTMVRVLAWSILG